MADRTKYPREAADAGQIRVVDVLVDLSRFEESINTWFSEGGAGKTGSQVRHRPGRPHTRR